MSGKSDAPRTIDLGDLGRDAVEQELNSNESSFLGVEEREALAETLDEGEDTAGAAVIAADGPGGSDDDRDKGAAGQDGADKRNLDGSRDVQRDKAGSDAGKADAGVDKAVPGDDGRADADRAKAKTVQDGDADGADPNAEDLDAAAAFQPPSQSAVGFLEEISPVLIQSAADKAAAARAEFENGDMPFADYERINSEYTQLKLRSEMIRDQNMANRNALWQNNQVAYLNHYPDLNKIPMYNKAFVDEVNWILNPDNTADNALNMDDIQVLDLARKRFEQINNIKLNTRAGRPAPEKVRTPDERRRAAAAAKAKTDQAAISDDIGDLPSAGLNEDASRWDHLDTLEGDDLEAALSRLTPAEQNLYAERD